MLKSSLLFKKTQTSPVNNSRIVRIKYAQFSGYYFHTDFNIKGNFQICVSVPLIFSHYLILIPFQVRHNYGFNDFDENKI